MIIKLKKRLKDYFYPNLHIPFKQLRVLQKFSGKGHLIVEIGCYKGGTTRALSKYNKIIAIDPFIGFYAKEDSSAKEIGEERSKVVSIFKKNIAGRDVTWIEKKSEEALKNWTTKIDGIFIDGEHTYKALEKDVGWIKHVRSGGFIAFHDVDKMGWPGVYQYVTEKIVPRYKLSTRCGSLWVFIK
jgi:hypothetical protein